MCAQYIAFVVSHWSEPSNKRALVSCFSSSSSFFFPRCQNRYLHNLIRNLGRREANCPTRQINKIFQYKKIFFRTVDVEQMVMEKNSQLIFLYLSGWESRGNDDSGRGLRFFGRWDGIGNTFPACFCSTVVVSVKDKEILSSLV